jgi:hypothetical protein
MFFDEGFYGHDDALYGAARLLRIVADSGMGVAELLADVPKFVSTPELRVDVPEERKFAIVDAAVRHFRATHDVVDVDGVRVLFGDGWGLIRASNTQPVLVMRFEALSESRLGEMRAEMEGWLREQESPSDLAPGPRSMTRRWIAITVVAAASTLLIGRAIAGAYVEYQWFQSLGAAAVWRVRTLDVVLMRAFCGLVAGAFAFVNLVA